MKRTDTKVCLETTDNRGSCQMQFQAANGLSCHQNKPLCQVIQQVCHCVSFGAQARAPFNPKSNKIPWSGGLLQQAKVCGKSVWQKRATRLHDFATRKIVATSTILRQENCGFLSRSVLFYYGNCDREEFIVE